MKSSPIFFDLVSFLLSSLVTDPSFMSISSLVLELWQLLLIRNLPEIRKSEKSPSEFCPISGDWDEWRIPNLARTFLIKCYWILRNTRVTAFTISELLQENQNGVKLLPHPPRLGLRDIQHSMSMLLDTKFLISLIMPRYYKIRQKFITKFLLHNATVLLQNATVITNCDSCYNMRRLLQKKQVYFLREQC